jgi:hypothetical protein
VVLQCVCLSQEKFRGSWVWLVNQERSAKSLRLKVWGGFTVYVFIARKISRILGLANELGEIREISRVTGLGWFYSVCAYCKEDFADLWITHTGATQPDLPGML